MSEEICEADGLLIAYARSRQQLTDLESDNLRLVVRMQAAEADASALTARAIRQVELLHAAYDALLKCAYGHAQPDQALAVAARILAELEAMNG